jgi:hypothetical protein
VVSVPSRQVVPLAAPPQSGDSLLFAADDPVLPSHPGSPVFGELRWDLSGLGLAANQVAGDAVLNFGRFLDPVSLGPAGGPAGPLRLAPAWLLRAKEVLAILLVPTRRTRHGRIDVYAVRESLSSSTVKAASAHIYALAVWATLNALPADLHRWEQSDLDDFLGYLATERTNSRTGGQGIDASSIRSYVNTLRTLHLLRETLTDGGLGFDPWEGMSADSVTGVDVSVRRTKPIPAEQYEPLMRNLWKVIDQIVPDVLAAADRADTLKAVPLQTWWANVNQHVAADEIAGADAILAHRNLAPTMQAFRRLLTENPDIILASDADVQQRSGIRYQWFSRNRQRLIDAGILEAVHPPTPAARCAVPGCDREARRRGWCLAHVERWRGAAAPDPASWQATEQAQLPLGPPPATCAVATCGRETRGGPFCGGHVQRWRSAGKPDIDRWASSDAAAVPIGGWCYRSTGFFPEVRTVAEHLTAWLENPEHRIPLRARGELAAHFKRTPGGVWAGDEVNRGLLARMIGVRPDALRGREVGAIVDDAVTRGQTNVGGLCEITAVRWADGGERPWIDGIDPALLGPLTHFCRICAIVFIYMFSGMRDSEVQSLKKGCVEEFWGHLTLTGKEFKTFRGAQARWVVIEPVARAARIAEALTWHHERIVVSARPGTDPVIDPGQEIDGLIATMNLAADLGLLEAIPDGASIRPHRFRRTFAITARKYPWMQIALHWQFKHASHYMTQGYYALNDDVTAEDNEVAGELVEAAVDRLADLYELHQRNEPLYGSAASRLADEFAVIATDVASVEREDSRGFEGLIWRHAEVRKRLRGSALRLYPGVALDCAFGPGGACGGVEAPNWNACDPGCANAILDPTQLAFLKDAADRIRSYLADEAIGTALRLLLEGQLDDLTEAIARHESHPAPGRQPTQR